MPMHRGQETEWNDESRQGESKFSPPALLPTVKINVLLPNARMHPPRPAVPAGSAFRSAEWRRPEALIDPSLSDPEEATPLRLTNGNRWIKMDRRHTTQSQKHRIQ
jgi:hypothetical protein